MQTKNPLVQPRKVVAGVFLLLILFFAFSSSNTFAAHLQEVNTETPVPETSTPVFPIISTNNQLPLIDNIGIQVIPDNREQVMNTMLAPWRMNAYLEVRDLTGNLYVGRCSGWFIGPHTVITNAHCIYNPEKYTWTGHYAKRIRVFPGKNGDSVAPYGYQDSTVFKVNPAWIPLAEIKSPESEAADYAAIILPNDDLGNIVGFYRYGYFNDAFLMNRSNIHLSGYPGDVSPPRTQWVSTGSPFTISPNLLGYPLYTYEGSSGSPVWYDDPSYGPVVVAIHGYGDNQSINIGVRITQNVATTLQSWGAAYAPLTDIPCPQSGGVIFYYNANYDCNGLGENNGYVQRSTAGWQNISGGMNENASSVKMPSGWSVMLYENYNRGGGKKCLNSADSWLSDFNYLSTFPNTSVPIADHVSSFEVFTTTGCSAGSGTPTVPPQPGDGIEICDLTNFGAPCKTYTYINNSACTNLASDGWDNKIESLRFKGIYVGGYDIILFDDNSCGTHIARYGSDASSLGGLNNLTGSFRIEQQVPPITSTPDPSDGIDLCDNTNWGAPCKRYTFINNEYCINLVPDGWGERADSLRFIGSYVSNYDIIVYDDSSCATYNARYGSDEYDMGAFKNAISSIRIEKHTTPVTPVPPGNITLCDGTNYGQPCQAFTYVRNDYCTNLQPYGWDNRADSLKFVDGYIGEFDVILYDDNGCNIYNARPGSDIPDLGAFKNSIGSIRIERHGPKKPDLIPYPRTGRSDPVIISSSSGTTTNTTLYAGEPIYIDWGTKNNGSVNALAHNVKLTIDGQTFIDYPFGSLNSGATSGFDDWMTTWDIPGTFTVSLTLDPNLAVDESDEGNNVWSGQFTWLLRPPNQFNKIAPADRENNQPLSINLSWSNSSGFDSYQYCYDSSDNSTCNTSWLDVGTSTSVNLPSLNPGTPYYWQVRATNSSDSTYADGNTWWSFITASPPPNDDFDNATQLSVIPYMNTQTTAGATTAGDDPEFTCVTGKKYNTVWYEYIPAGDGALSINTEGSSFDTVLEVWSGSRGNLLSQACNDDATGFQSEVQLQVVAGTVYYIEVAGYSTNDKGPLKISVNPAYNCSAITGWCGEYFDNETLSGTPVLVRDDPAINFEWQSGSPDSLVPADHFSARWTKTVYFNGGDVNFKLLRDDGIRLIIDGVTELEAWYYGREWISKTINLTQGDHTLVVEAYEIDGWAAAKLLYNITTTNFSSAGSYDGWVLESSETSSRGGTMSVSGTVRIGDDVSNKQYRAILYFNTGGLPDDANINKVTLKIKKYTSVGTSPFTTHGNLIADIRKGYFGYPPLQITDFQAIPSKLNVGRFTTISGAPGWYQLVMETIDDYSYVNLTGVTQFRLRFGKDDNNDWGNDFISFYAGEALLANRPVLSIEYYVP